MNINLKEIFDRLYNYVIIKFNNTLPLFKINDDIDILTSDIYLNKNIIINWYNKKIFTHKIIKINNSHIQLDLIKIGEKKLTIRFDLFEKIYYTKFSIDDNIYKLILQNKIYNGVAYIPSLLDDLTLRYCEYVEYIDKRKDKIKHLNYVNNFKESFYKIKVGEKKSKLNYKNINTIYNSIIIWGHGIQYIQEIIHNLIENINCYILNIKKNNIDNIDDFIKKCYKLEMINSNHIHNKTKYLKNVDNKYIHILIKNYGAKFKTYGSGTYAVIADENLVKWKWDIREKYNPKSNNIHIKPLPPNITHNHIIHITDSDKETEYLCNVILNNKPSFFENKIINNIFIPWHINIINNIKIEIVDINILYVNLVHIKKCKIIDTPHYKYVNDDKKSYIDYYNKYIGTYLQDNHCTLQFDKLITIFKPEQYNFEESRLIITNKNYIVCDGLHRLAILKKNNINKIKIAVI